MTGSTWLVADKMVEGSDASVICVYVCVINFVVIPETGQSQSVQESPDCQGETSLSGHLPVQVATPQHIVIVSVVKNSFYLIQNCQKFTFIVTLYN